MAVVKQSTLPTVLKEYMPEYEPTFKQDQGEITGSKSRDSHRTTTRSAQQGTKNSGIGRYASSKPGRSNSPVSRYKRRSADNERYESLSASWEVAKTEVKRERHEQLQEKLRLQQRLLHLQDELSEHRRSQEEQSRAQRQESERSKKQAQQAALQEVCKQSLVEDRKAAAAGRRRQGRVESQKDDVSSEDTHRSPPSTPEQNRPTRQRQYVSRSPTLPKTPMQELDSEEEQEEEFNQSASSSVFESLPWHHQQLYKLYGEEADYFIHPKIEPKSDEPVAPKIKKSTVEKSIAQPPDEGHLGAEKLWVLLRGESRTKLLKEDGRFPHELKHAYSAFVRESLNLGRDPVVRNFTATDDVPDMNKLLDQSLLRNIRKYRHKTGIMYRASRANNDRTNILLYNNPLPDITEGATDTISRYMPSWTDDVSDTSDPAYMKWLAGRQQDKKIKQDSGQTDSTEDKEEQKSETDLDLGEVEPDPDPKHKSKPKSKLYFLTEREATTPGDFTERFYRERNKKDLPQGHTKPLSAKAQSSLGFSDPRTSQGSPDGSTRSATFTSKQDLMRRFTSDWQPLSMTALVEYKEQLGAAGAGDFQNGRMKMWPVAPSTTA